MKPHFQRFKKYKGNTKWREVIKDPDWKKTSTRTTLSISTYKKIRRYGIYLH